MRQNAYYRWLKYYGYIILPPANSIKKKWSLHAKAMITYKKHHNQTKN